MFVTLKLVHQKAFQHIPQINEGASQWCIGKESVCNTGDPGSIPVSGRSLEKEMATNASIVAWENPCTEETSKLQCMGSQSWTHDNTGTNEMKC